MVSSFVPRRCARPDDPYHKELRYTPSSDGRRLGNPMSFVSHVECTICGARHDAKRLLTVCETCGQMLAVRYDLARVTASLTKRSEEHTSELQSPYDLV